MQSVKVLTVSFLAFLLFCAQRDNRFDPQSPLHRVFSPELSLVISYDSSRTAITPDNTIHAFSPFVINFTVSAQGDENDSEQLPVLFHHYLNGDLLDQQINISEIKVTLLDSGFTVWSLNLQTSMALFLLRKF